MYKYALPHAFALRMCTYMYVRTIPHSVYKWTCVHVRHLSVHLLCVALQIIHLKRFQFFNGRWVKSQRKVRFPARDLDPLRYTAKNGNKSRTADTTRPSTGSNVSPSSKEREETQQPSPPDSSRPQDDPGSETTTTLANGGGEHPVISEEKSTEGVGAGAGRSRSKQEQLDETLHRREGSIYNLVAITVSCISHSRVFR